MVEPKKGYVHILKAEKLEQKGDNKKAGFIILIMKINFLKEASLRICLEAKKIDMTKRVSTTNKLRLSINLVRTGRGLLELILKQQNYRHSWIPMNQLTSKWKQVT
jgi:hypothetical protein